jgi:Xaa-Pro aminopeptidase
LFKIRIEKLKRKFLRENFEGILINSPEDIKYLTDFICDDGLILLSKNKTILIVSPLYYEQAKSEVKVDVIKSNDISKTVFELCKKFNIKKLGFEANSFTYQRFLEFKKSLKKVKILPTNNILANLREIKDDIEISFIKKACDVASSCFEYILSILKEGIEEREIIGNFENYLRIKGAERIPFQTIVASGENSAYPHYFKCNRKLKKGDFVILDWGVVYNGYCSDITRTVVIGKATNKQKEIYETVYETQSLVLNKIKSRIKCSYFDKIARNYFKKMGYLGYFCHNLGHGVGIAVHENPYISTKNNKILKPNMVLTIEPGIYIPNFGGVRIEDMVLIKKDGCEVLTSAPKELIEI